MSISECTLEAPPVRLGFRQSVAKELEDRGMFKEADRWLGCHKTGVIHTCWSCNEEIILPYRCELRICKKCAEKQRGRFWHKYMKLKSMQLKGGYVWKFLTLTLQHQPGDPIAKRVNLILKSSRILIKEFWGKDPGFGCLGVMEVTAKGYVHFHALIYGSWQSQVKLSDRWEELTNGSYIVDIRRVKGFKKALSDVLKYISKVPEYADPESAVDLLLALKRKRRVFALGKFYNVKTTEEPYRFVCPMCGGDTYYSGIRTLAWWEHGQFLVDLWKDPP